MAVGTINPTMLSGGGGGSLSGLESGGNVLAVAGLVTQAIGSFYSAKSQQFQLESDALSLDFQQSISNLNARASERDAAAILEAGRQRKALVTLRFGQIRGQQRASTAARGIAGGVGSAAEVAASTELAKDLDAFTIDANAFRQASAARLQAVNQRNRAELLGVSARNLRRSAGAIIPGLSAATTLLGGAGGVASGIAQRSRGER